jgi:hypothetical protein
VVVTVLVLLLINDSVTVSKVTVQNAKINNGGNSEE